MTHYLDRRFRQVGRIKRAAGTDHKPTIKLLDGMLTGLFERGRLDILRDIQKGTYTPLQVWTFYRTNELHRLPTAATMSPLEASMSAWIDDRECSDAHRRSLHQSLRHLMSVGTKSVTVADIPELLRLLRPKLKAVKHPRSFNLAKAACQAFVRSTLSKGSPLYFEVMAVETLRVVPQRKKNPLSPAELVTLTDKLSAWEAEAVWTMALHGMGPTEYAGKWHVEGVDRVHIFGTKRSGRDRVVPYLREISYAIKHDIPYKALRLTLSEASDGSVTPYDLRRSYANWMEAAGIPRTRRKMYLGHGAVDVTDLYERHEVDRYIEADALLLTGYLLDAMKPQKAKMEIVA